jgi:hypothetical protein
MDYLLLNDGLMQAVEISDEISGVFPGTDVYYFAIEGFQEFRQFFFSIFDYIGNFHLIERANDSTTCETLNKTEFLSGLCYDVDSFKFVVFT